MFPRNRVNLDNGGCVVGNKTEYKDVTSPSTGAPVSANGGAMIIILVDTEADASRA